MVSKAISAQGTKLDIESGAGTAKNITGVSKANPAVVTATAHGFTNGDVVNIAGIVGMTELNGNGYVVQNVATNTFELSGIDSTGFGTWSSGGTATPITWAASNEHRSYSGFDGAASEQDATTMTSVAKEKRVGLQDFGGVQFDVNNVETDPFQIAAKAARAAGAVKWFRLTKKNGYKKVFQGLIKSFSENGSADGIIQGSIAVTLSGAVADVL